MLKYLQKHFDECSNLQNFFYTLKLPIRKPTEIKSIIVTNFNGIGDVILTSGCIRELQKLFPKAKITLCCSFFNAEFMKYNPQIEVIPFPLLDVNNKNQKDYLKQVIELCAPLYDRENDLGVCFQLEERNPLHYIVLALANCQYRFGFLSGSSFLLTNGTSLFEDGFDCKRHRVGKYFYLLDKLAKSFNLTVKNLNFKHELIIPSVDINVKDHICISLSASLQNKKYPLEKILAAVKGLDNIVWIGGEREETDLQLPGINLINKTTLIESMNVVKNCKLFIGNDTGMIHVASCFNKPAVMFSNESLEKIDLFIRSRCYEASNFLQFRPWYGLKFDHANFDEAYEACIENSAKHCTVLHAKESLHPCDRAVLRVACFVTNKSHCISTIPIDEVKNAINEKL